MQKGVFFDSLQRLKTRTFLIGVFSFFSKLLVVRLELTRMWQCCLVRFSYCMWVYLVLRTNKRLANMNSILQMNFLCFGELSFLFTSRGFICCNSFASRRNVYLMLTLAEVVLTVIISQWCFSCEFSENIIGTMVQYEALVCLCNPMLEASEAFHNLNPQKLITILYS